MEKNHKSKYSYSALLFYLIILISTFLLTSCIISKNTYSDKKFYIIGLTDEKQNKNTGPTQNRKKNKSILKISEVRIAYPFKSKNFIYRLDDLEFESDYYNEFLISPEDMFTDGLAKFLSESDLFSHVFIKSGHIKEDYLLETMISSLYGDYINKNNPKAVMEIDFIVLKKNSFQYEIFYNKRYKKEISIKKKSIVNLVNAWNTLFFEILYEFKESFKKEF